MFKVGTLLGTLFVILLFTSNVRSISPEILIEEGGEVSSSVLTKIRTAIDRFVKSITEDTFSDKTEIDQFFKLRIQKILLSILSSEGYFCPTLELSLDNLENKKTWNIRIIPGKQSLISNANLKISGPANLIQSDPSFVKRIEALQERWKNQIGEPFNNTEWRKKKLSLLSEIASKDFPFCHIVQSSARISDDKMMVDLSLHIDSGPRVTLGALNVHGLKRNSKDVVNRYVKYNFGETFDQKLVNAWKKNLQSTGFFRGVFVSLSDSTAEDFYPVNNSTGMNDKNHSSGTVAEGEYYLDNSFSDKNNLQKNVLLNTSEINLPVQIKVIEAPKKRAALSFGIDDDAGFQLESLYRQNIVNSNPLILSTGFSIDRLHQRAFIDFNFMPSIDLIRHRHDRNAFGFLIDCSDIQEVKVYRFALGATHIQQINRGHSNQIKYDSHLGTLIAYDLVQRNSINFKLPSLIGTFELARNNIDNQYNPRRGNSVFLGFAAGITFNEINSYTKVKFRIQKWWPFGLSDFIYSRFEIGKAWLGSNVNKVPDDFGFRTGGAHSIRGYGYQSIGVKRGDAVIGGSRLVLFSFEYNHNFREKLGLGLFIEGGNASDEFKIKSLAIGYGIGIRVQTLAGPILFDIAYGVKDKTIRSHFSLGISF